MAVSFFGKPGGRFLAGIEGRRKVIRDALLLLLPP